MASIVFTDATGTWRLHNGKLWPGTRFRGWTPTSIPVGNRASRLSDGAVSMFRNRDDYGVSFELPMIPSARSNNLLQQSDACGTAPWSVYQSAVSADAANSPDGNTTADKLTENTANDSHGVTQTISGLADSTVVTYSHCVKASERSWVYLEVLGKDAVARYRFFNISTGAAGTQSGLTDSGLYYAGFGFWRPWIAASVNTGGGTPLVGLFTSTGDNVLTFAGTLLSGVYAWAAQAEAISAKPPSPILNTTTAARSNVSMLEIADRLAYHLQNGGTCSVYTADASWNAYATCGLKPGTTPQLALTNPRALEYTLSLQLINVAGSPARMLATYADQ